LVTRRPVISFSDVSLVVDGKEVLSHVNWKVLPGQNWVVVGPNGAGKTSLLSIINGYRWPSSGDVSVLGRKFGESDTREVRTRIGLLSSYLDWIVEKDEEVIEFVVSGKFGSTRMWSRPTSADLAEAALLLETLGCSEHRGKLISQVSQGERQKVAIARAMMGRPKLMVLDEPCEGLDVGSRESFLQGLESLMAAADPPTFIEVTHRTEDVPRGFTHALLLRGGRVVAEGRVEDVMTSANLTGCLGVRVDLKRWGSRRYMVPRPRKPGR
jgi:iron complex transport system ATP-binding protein